MSEKKFLSLSNKLILFIFILVFSLQLISTINQYSQTEIILSKEMMAEASSASSEFTLGLDKRLSSLDTLNEKLGFVNIYSRLEGQIIMQNILDNNLALEKIAFLDLNGNLVIEKTRTIQNNDGEKYYSTRAIQDLIGLGEVATLSQNNYFIISVPVKIEDSLAGNLLFQYSNVELIQQEKKLIYTNLLFLLIFVIIGAFGAIFISGLITRPIIALKESTEKLSQGKLNVQTKIYSQDEIGQLGITFNKMAHEIKELKENLEKKVEERTLELSRTKHDLERRTIQANNARLATLNILEDVEESKTKLAEAYNQLRGLDKLKNEFLSFTSHELKTPLTPILIQAQMLEEGDFGKLSGEQKKSVEMIVRNMRELNQLIGDVLDVSVIQTSNLKIFPERADMKVLIKQVVEKMESSAKEKNISIKLDLSTLHPFVFDVRRIGQVLTNLLSNAIKFTPENGHVIIKTEEDSGRVMVKVKDDGVGISEEDKGKLFKAFSQVVASYKLKQKGTGLGLAICKGIIDAHKGKIGVESQIGKGSMFYFVLPKKLHLEKI